jgi:hypothetical protein
MYSSNSDVVIIESVEGLYMIVKMKKISYKKFQMIVVRMMMMTILTIIIMHSIKNELSIITHTNKYLILMIVKMKKRKNMMKMSIQKIHLIVHLEIHTLIIWQMKMMMKKKNILHRNQNLIKYLTQLQKLKQR